MTDKKFYGLIIPKKTQKIQNVSKSIFDSDSEEESPRLPFKREPVSQVSSKSTMQKQKLTLDDPTIYEYDSIYDSMKAKKSQKEEKVKKEPRFIQSLLKAADKRKKDHDRRLEKKIETERIKEGDEFKDKESFVTSAYKQKMLEMEKEEEEERRQAQLEEMMDVTKQQDLSGFYRHYLNQTIGEEKVPVFGDRNHATSSQSSENRKEVKSIKIEKVTDDSDDSKALPDKYKSHKSKDPDHRNKDENGKKSAQNKKHSSSRLGDSDHDQHTSSSRKTSMKEIERKHDKPASSDRVHSENYGLPKSRDDAAYDDHHGKSDEKFQEHVKVHKKRRHDSSSSSEEETTDKKLKLSDEEESRSLCNTSQNEENFDDKDDDDILDSDTESHPDEEVKKVEVAKNPKLEMSYKFMKRTVGEVFDQAQARYFKRMAARGC